MPGTEIGRLNIRIAASANELESTLTKTESRLKGFKKTGESSLNLSSVMSGFGQFGLASAGVRQAIDLFKELDATVKEQAARADELHDFAAAVGGTASGLFAIRQGAFGAGEAIDKGLEKLSRGIGEALNGSEEAEKSFAKLGLSAEQLASVPLDEAFHRIADQIKKLPTDVQRSAAAFDVFGKRGQALMETLGRGREFFEAIKAHGIETGALPSESLSKAFDHWEQQSKAIGREWDGIKNSASEIMGLSAAQDIILKGLAQYRGFLQIGGGTEAESARLAELAAADKARADAATARAQKFRQDQAKLLQSAKEVTAQFDRQAATIGLESNEARAIQEAMKSWATSSAKVRDELNRGIESAREIDRLQSRQKLLEGTMTPLEKADRALGDMEMLLKRNKINMQQLGRGAAQVADELIRAADIQEKAALPAPDALLQGSQAARSFLIDLERRPAAGATDKGAQLLQAVEKLRLVEEEQKNDVKRLIDLMREKGILRIANF
jgi:hypothetical protein